MTYEPNPPWVDRLLHKHWNSIESLVGPELMPVVGETSRSGKRSFHEFGCGHYGCVLPTNTPGVVLKVTSDASEAAFVSCYFFLDYKPTGVVRYDRIVETPESHRGRRTFLIWRQEAENVGLVSTAWGYRRVERYDEKYGQESVREFYRNLDKFKRIASRVRDIVRKSERPYDLLSEAVALYSWAHSAYAERNDRFRGNAKNIAYSAAELSDLAMEMANTHAGYLVGQAFEYYLDQKILLADVHAFNIGEVVPSDHKSWELVITDPGHMVPLDPKWLQVQIPRLA